MYQSEGIYSSKKAYVLTGVCTSQKAYVSVRSCEHANYRQEFDILVLSTESVTFLAVI